MWAVCYGDVDAHVWCVDDADEGDNEDNDGDDDGDVDGDYGDNIGDDGDGDNICGGKWSENAIVLRPYLRWYVWGPTHWLCTLYLSYANTLRPQVCVSYI